MGNVVTEEIIVEKVPLAKGRDGVLRISGTRVQLEIVIQDFQRGASAEQIAKDYSTLRLADIYQVIAYYLRHTDEVNAYVEQRRKEADELRQTIEARFPQTGTRERLLTRRRSS